MDHVYLLVDKKTTTDELFNLTCKINKNFYVVNERKDKIEKLKKELNGGNENGK